MKLIQMTKSKDIKMSLTIFKQTTRDYIMKNKVKKILKYNIY